MKKSIILFLFSAIFMSCSSDDDNADRDNFFNLKEGNVWVYKRFHFDSEGNPAQNMSGAIDTVRITGTHIIDGKKYFKVSHTMFTGSNQSDERLEYQRVDSVGHLVNEGGRVIHPGKDLKYTSTTTDQFGKLEYKMEPEKEISFEGKNYLVSPYVSYFTPVREDMIAGKGASLEYQEGIGLVVSHARYISSKIYFEDRLIYYELK